MKSKNADANIPSYPTAQALIREQAGRIFMELADKTFAEVGYLFGLDRFLKNESSMRSAVTRAYNLVLAEPEKYGVSIERAAEVQKIVSSRNIVKKEPETLREANQEAADISTVMLNSRDLAASLVRRKLDYLDRNPKALKDMSLKELIGAIHILFDKGQIIQGRATENIAVLSKISDNMTPDEALAAIQTMREESMASK